MCIVTPNERRSFTLRTLLMTSRPRSSKTRTFQMGSPVDVVMGAEGARRPSDGAACVSSVSEASTASLRLRIFLREAGVGLVDGERYGTPRGGGAALAYLPVSQGIAL